MPGGQAELVGGNNGWAAPPPDINCRASMMPASAGMKTCAPFQTALWQPPEPNSCSQEALLVNFLASRRWLAEASLKRCSHWLALS